MIITLGQGGHYIFHLDRLIDNSEYWKRMQPDQQTAMSLTDK